jgi:hypothetical protein
LPDRGASFQEGLLYFASPAAFLSCFLNFARDGPPAGKFHAKIQDLLFPFPPIQEEGRFGPNALVS